MTGHPSRGRGPPEWPAPGVRNWGIYLTCPLPVLKVRRHLRRFLMVETKEHDAQLYFRMYDPWVLRILLPTCSTQQRKDFLGHIQTLAFEPDDESHRLSVLLV